MPSQIVLEWEVSVAGTPFGPAAAAAALAAVELYDNATTDPVLGQLFGLTVDADVTAPGAGVATRTLTLNMDAANAPTAPPPFPCNPRTSTPPQLPYPLRESVTLPGSFVPENGVMAVPTTATQVPSLAVGDIVQFLSQIGVFYEIGVVASSAITLTAPYTGITGATGAYKEKPVPVVLAAIYSTSPLDTNGVATVPAIVADAGARTVELTYDDSAGGGPFTATVQLTGKRPAAVTLEGGSVDIAVILGMEIASAGAFDNSVGQITLVELSSELPTIPINATPTNFAQLTDEAQLLITRHLAYLPPSYFALAGQGSSRVMLTGDFFVTTGSKYVPTSVDQSAVLSAGDVLQFASQPALPGGLPTVEALNANGQWKTEEVFYVVEDVGPKSLTLTTPYTGLDENFTGYNNANSNAGTKGNLGSKVEKKATGAFWIDPSEAAPPSDDALSAPLGQFVAPGVAVPPPNPPFAPATFPAPTFLSNLFTRTLQLALKVSVVPQAITFLP